MGHELRRPLREAIPDGLLTKSERYVLLEIADLANDKTRIAKFGPDKVAKLVGMTPAAVRKHVQRMSSKGIELRIPLGHGSDGRPVFAHEGQKTNYQIPSGLIALLSQLPEGGQTVHPVEGPEGGQSVQALAPEGGQNDARGWTEKPERVDSVSTPSPQLSPKNTPILLPPQGPVAMIRAATDATEEEADEIVQMIRNGSQVKSWSGLIKKLISNGDLAAKLADVRARNAMYAAIEAGNAPSDAPWCGQCDEQTRILLDQDYQPKRCPRCHRERNRPLNGRRPTGYRPHKNSDIPAERYNDDFVS